MEDDQKLQNTNIGRQESFQVVKIGLWYPDIDLGQSKWVFPLKIWVFGQIRTENDPGVPPGKVARICK